MPGASDQTKQVKILNANWVAGPDGSDGQFQLMIVTEDERAYTLTPSPAATAALVALALANTVLMWDPENRTLIAANIVGVMPWTKRYINVAAAASSPTDRSG